jgi:hypothetical protein
MPAAPFGELNWQLQQDSNRLRCTDERSSENFLPSGVRDYEHRRDRIRRLTEELLQLPKPLLKRVSPGSSV